MKWIDPHDDTFCAKNLDQEFYFECKRSREIKDEIEELKKAFDEESCLIYPNDDLNETALKIMSCCEFHFHRFQTSNGYWIALVLSMLSHGRIMEREIDIVIAKSPIQQEPMYYDNIEWIEEGRWLVPRRKSEAKDSRSPRNGQNYKINAVSRGGSKDWDTAQQNLFSDLH